MSGRFAIHSRIALSPESHFFTNRPSSQFALRPPKSSLIVWLVMGLVTQTILSVTIGASEFLDSADPKDTELVNQGNSKWGDLFAKFEYDGDPPEVRSTKVPGLPAAVETPKDETWSVNKDGAIRDVVIWLHTENRGPPITIHPRYDKNANKPVEVMTDAICFKPRVTCLRTAQSLRIINNGSFADTNIGFQSHANRPSDYLLRRGDSIEVVFEKPEKLPIRVAATIQPWLQGFVVVKEHPYVGSSDADGRLLINDLPIGEHTFQIWHSTGFVQRAVRDGKVVSFPRGMLTINVGPGQNDLGTIRFSDPRPRKAVP